MAYEQLSVVFEEPWLAVITLTRPRQLNTLSYETVLELLAVCEALAGEEALRAVILTGAADIPLEGRRPAPRVFVAGADVKHMSAVPQEGNEVSRHYIASGQRLMCALEALPAPVIAAVDGLAFGGGFELALACDVILATPRSSFGLPEAKLGLMPGWGGTQRLPRLIGAHNARHLILSGDTIDATEAQRLGIAQRLVLPEALLDEARALAARIAACAPISVRMAKKAINEGLLLPLAEGLALEAAAFDTCFHSADRLEGTLAFVEKRKPVYKGR